MCTFHSRIAWCWRLTMNSTVSDLLFSVAYDYLPYLGALYLLSEYLVEGLVELARLGYKRQE